MKQGDIERLRKSEGGTVKITCSDGEILEAKILHVDEEYRDVVYDLLSSTRPEKYPQGQASAYTIEWDDILDFRENSK
jgi:hypothetical protein